MKRFSEQFNTKSKSITLSSTEKKELQKRLVSYMEYHPLPAELKREKKAVAPVLVDGQFTTVSIPFRFLLKISSALAALVLIVVPFMAERSVPGDALYAVKVQFNEEVRSTLTFDSVDRVEWETERINRRIAEARLLASEGRLTDEMEAEVAQAVRTHTESAQAEIAFLRTQDAEEATIASIAFDSTLEAQAVSLKDNDSDETGESGAGTQSQNLIADAVDDSRALYGPENGSSTPSYDKLMARVEMNTTRMYEFRDSLQKTSPEAAGAVTRRIEDIERSVAEAIEKSAEPGEESRQILVDVLKRAQKLIVFMTDLDVSQTVDIDDLVPMMLTAEEKVEQTIVYKAEIVDKVSIINTFATEATSTPSGVLEKIQKGVVDIEELNQQIATTTDFLQVKNSAEKAIAIADDLLLLIESLGQPVVEIDGPEEELETASSSASTTPADVEPPINSETSGSSSASSTATSSVDA